MSEKILIIGHGQLGKEFEKFFSILPCFSVSVLKRSEFDYTNFTLLKNRLLSEKPDYVINCAAFTNVDSAETKDSLVVTLNTMLPFMLGQYSDIMGFKLIHFSTDYVFDGKKDGVYTEEDTPRPLNYYGITKDDGDVLLEKRKNVLILRVSCVYSPEAGFYKKIRDIAKSQGSVKVVNDQFTVPTSVNYIVRNVAYNLHAPINGLYNLVPNGRASYADFACKILADTTAKVIPVSTKEYSGMVKQPLAKRPKNSVLYNRKWQNLQYRSDFCFYTEESYWYDDIKTYEID